MSSSSQPETLSRSATEPCTSNFSFYLFIGLSSLFFLVLLWTVIVLTTELVARGRRMEALRSRDVLWTYDDDTETSMGGPKAEVGGVADGSGQGQGQGQGQGAFQRAWEERMGWEEEKRVLLRA